MALEAVVFSQDHPLTCHNNSCRDQYNLYNFGVGLAAASSSFTYDLIPNYPNPFEINSIHNNVHNQFWDNQQQYVNSGYSSPEGQCDCTTEQHLSGEAEVPAPPPATAAPDGGSSSAGRRKRRRRSCKNKEEVEQQRMTHIAVERNRRKQMNEYLAVIRSLMPPSYAQRGDQASIVGGAINYMKELEQLLQSLEARKRTKRHHEQPEKQPQPPSEQPPEGGSNSDININDFTGLLSFPQQYLNGSTQQGSTTMNSGSGAGHEVQVTMVESHANVKILAKKQPKQLLRLVAGFQGLRLSVLHLNVISVHPSFFLYSFSLKVEEGGQVNSVDGITAAANHILGQMREEAAGLL